MQAKHCTTDLHRRLIAVAVAHNDRHAAVGATSLEPHADREVKEVVVLEEWELDLRRSYELAAVATQSAVLADLHAEVLQEESL